MISTADASRSRAQRRFAWANLRTAVLAPGRTGDTVWAVLDQGSGLVASALSFLLLGRTLGPAGYGAFVGLYALMGPVAATSQSGVFLAALEHVVRNREDPAQVARSCLSMTAANATIWVPLLAAIAPRWIDALPGIATLLLIGTEFWLNGIIATSTGIVQALSGYSAAARLRVMVGVARIGLLTALAATNSLTLTTLAVWQAVMLGAAAVFALSRVSQLLGVPARPGRIRRSHVRSALLYGVGIGASSAQNDGDKFVLNAAHHQADAGRYGAAYRLMGIVLLPVTALAGATHLSFLDGEGADRSQSRRAIRLSAIAMAYAIPAVICLVAVAPVVPRILTKDFAEMAFILQLLAPVVILRGVGVFPMNGLMGLGRNALRTKLLVANALLSLALYAALIPKYAWQGALGATLASEMLLCASGWCALLLCERTRRAQKHASAH